MKKYLFTIVLISLNLFAQAQDFITRWDLSIAGSGATQLTFGVGTSGTCSYTWETIPAGAVGSGTFSGNSITITGLPAGAMIRLMIDTTNFRQIKINYGPDKERLKDVEQWGGVHWNSMETAFAGCSNLNITSTDIPDLSNVTSMFSMFRLCDDLNGPLNIGSWNTSTITNMSLLFASVNVTGSLFNQPIGSWNTSNVVDMSGMFSLATNFNQPIGNWNTSSVTNMSGMFANTWFNQPIGNWNTSNVTYMDGMFINALFNQPIGNWNTSNVTNMNNMFMGAMFNQPIGNWNTTNVTNMSGMFAESVFNQTIGSWNTSNVTNMSGMFSTSLFNQPIGNWNTISVTNMSYMFCYAFNFNQPIGNWNTSNVINMSYMFYGAPLFNQPIGNWDTSLDTSMNCMFRDAISFNQPIGNWNTSNVINMSYMFSNDSSFNQPIGSWNTQNVKNMGSMFYNASSFNQSLSTWQLNANVLLWDLFHNSGLDCLNYSATLIGWANNPQVPLNKSLGAQNLTFGLFAVSARNFLISNKGWTFMGDIANNNCCLIQFNPINHTACNSFYFNSQTLTNSGIYYDTLLNVNGCDSLITLNLTINQIDTSVSQSGANFTANATGATYQWLTCNPYQEILGETNQNYVAAANGEYAVVVSQNGCTDTSFCYTVVGIGTNTFELSNKIKIYPNPVFHTLQIEAENEIQLTSVKLIDVTGKVLVEHASSSLKKISIDMSSYSSDNYFIQIESPNFSYVKKVYKE